MHCGIVLRDGAGGAKESDREIASLTTRSGFPLCSRHRNRSLINKLSHRNRSFAVCYLWPMKTDAYEDRHLATVTLTPKDCASLMQ